MTGIVIVGRMGSGKDYAAEKIVQALNAASVPTDAWALGETYYAILAERLRTTVDAIRANKAQHVPALQEIGMESAAQGRAVQASVLRFVAARTRGIVPVVIARKREESNALRRVGARVLYIEADEATRIARITQRDGVPPTRAMLDAPTEPRREDIAPDVVLVNGAGVGQWRMTLSGSSILFSSGLAAPARRFVPVSHAL